MLAPRKVKRRLGEDVLSDSDLAYLKSLVNRERRNYREELRARVKSVEAARNRKAIKEFAEKRANKMVTTG